ncbi:MAG TPA: zf-HC2 domain-containing protein [Polyangiales bacterium]|nr:zf-HC2 domain-containing protein [Polyangiales bacterium]
MSDHHPDLKCSRVVEMVTDYLEHALSIEDRNQLEQHLLICGACETFIDQHTTMVRALAALAADPPAPAPTARAEALATFRRQHDKDEP